MCAPRDGHSDSDIKANGFGGLIWTTARASFRAPHARSPSPPDQTDRTARSAPLQCRLPHKIYLGSGDMRIEMNSRNY